MCNVSFIPVFLLLLLLARLSFTLRGRRFFIRVSMCVCAERGYAASDCQRSAAVFDPITQKEGEKTPQYKCQCRQCR